MEVGLGGKSNPAIANGIGKIDSVRHIVVTVDWRKLKSDIVRMKALVHLRWVALSDPQHSTNEDNNCSQLVNTVNNRWNCRQIDKYQSTKRSSTGEMYTPAPMHAMNLHYSPKQRYMHTCSKISISTSPRAMVYRSHQTIAEKFPRETSIFKLRECNIKECCKLGISGHVRNWIVKTGE